MASKCDPMDFYNLEAELSSEQKSVRDSAKEFVKSRCQSQISANYENAHFPEELISEMGQLGFLGCSLEGYGCANLDPLSYGLVMKELERCDSALRSFASVQTSLAMYAIHQFGSEDQKKHFLPQMAAGKMVGCFGLTEPDFGSNPAGMRTTAKKQGDSYVLKGSKTWITNAPIAHVAIVWAKDDEGVVRGYLVEKGTEGFEAPPIHNKLSLRASLTGSLFFQDCKISTDHLLPLSGGLKSPLMCLSQARFGIAFGAIGAAEDCFAEVLQYAKEREVFGKPLSAHQLVQRKLALMNSEITKANLIVHHLAKLKAAGQVSPEQISLAKQNNVQMALDVARTCRDILGANGISGEYRTMRHMCNLESVSTYEGTNDIHLLIMGQALTSMAAFS